MAETTDYGALMRRALEEIRTLRAQLAARREPIAIIGMACRYPGGADSPDAYWELLKSGTDAITEVPRSRWDLGEYFDADPDAPGKMYTRHGGFLDDIERFDAQFFGVSPLDARNMDPQQRLLLEVAWEALEHAGQVPGEVARTGVYVGSFMDDYLQLNFHAADRREIDAYNTLGLLRGLAAGRLAYALDLHGPAMQLDTACSSSLLAAHLAVQGLRNRECDLALAGGVNLILAPEVTIGLCRMKAMAADGRCKTFDARADGYVRGEGCGIVVLKRLSDAIADGDSIYAVIRGSAVNHDGRSNGLTAPNGTAQKTVIREALEDGGVAPHEVRYVEAHGTGTSLGDPIEALALGEILCRDREERLLVGSVKSNFGHLESAAGVAALMKAALSVHHGAIPPSLHFEQPNPHIPWDRLPIAVPTQLEPWPDESRVAGISSFGMSGTNVHMLIAAGPPASPPAGRAASPPPYVLTLSAPTEPALSTLADSYAAFVHDESLQNICYTAATGRRHFDHRRAVVANSTQELANKLREPHEPQRGKRPRIACDKPELLLFWGVRPEAIVREDATIVLDPTQHPLEWAARLYEAGLDLDWTAILGRGTKVALPTYPFQRQPFWVERRKRVEGASFRSVLSATTPRYLQDHRIDGRIVVPAAAYLAMAIESAGGACTLRDVTFPQALTFGDGEERTLQFDLGTDFRFATEETHCIGSIERGAEMSAIDIDESRFGDQQAPDGADAGIEIGPSFRWTRGVRRGDGEVLCRMEGPAGMHPGLIDSCLRTLALCREGNERFVPFRIEALRFRGGAPVGALRCHARAADVSADHLRGDVTLIDDSGVVLEVIGLDARRVRSRDEILQVEWETCPKAATAVAALQTVFVCEGEDVGPRLLELLKAHDGGDARLWIVTRNAQRVLSSDDVDPTHAWVWGLGQVVAMEQPRLRWTTVDVDGELPDLAPFAGTSENQLAFRNGVAYAPRLVRKHIQAAQKPLFRADATYLVTGAFGALGTRVAKWMVDEGARHLVLTSRNPAPAPDLGARVDVIAADLANRDDVARLFAQPIHGVIHAAGILDDALLTDLTWDRFERVFAPKVAGAWNLHEASLAHDLDFFVCFSSAASMIGSRGQANYAAANSSLDALVHHRRARGLPGLTINWGAWGESGMSARLEIRERQQAIGVDAIDPRAALEILGRLMRTDLAQAGVIHADWPKLVASLFPAPPPMFAHLLPVKAEPSDERIITTLAKTPADQRRTRLEAHLRGRIVEVVGHDPFPTAGNDLSFFEIGMDSLMSLDLRNRLQEDFDRTIPSVVAFEYPTIPELAGYLMEKVLPSP